MEQVESCQIQNIHIEYISRGGCNMKEEIRLARSLLKIPSPSGDERTIGLFLARRLRKNFDVKLQRVGTRYNILATRGTPNILLTTHIDIVQPQIPFRENETWLYGRGACDTKGIIAGMVCAGEDAVREGLDN